jgi:hypothetical protein
MQRAEISDSVYEQRRHVCEQCQWINGVLRDLETSADFETQYFERIGHNIKRFLEEAVPVSRVGLSLWTPATDVYVTCFAHNRNYDALIEVEGVGKRSTRLEVTTTETDRSAMRRQALSRTGSAHLAGPVSRTGRVISFEEEMVDVDKQNEERIQLALERLRDKLDSGSYGSDTAMLVYLTEYLPVTLALRAELAESTVAYLHRAKLTDRVVYYYYHMNGVVDEIRA